RERERERERELVSQYYLKMDSKGICSAGQMPFVIYQYNKRYPCLDSFSKINQPQFINLKCLL
ncbi:MAG: hypothetical protein LBL90_00195, partial [Prevotellaceae bacterium]|nr:hypothetical protein [Prevotellaceae bacterium]